jgi:hypothetical protein
MAIETTPEYSKGASFSKAFGGIEDSSTQLT